MKALTYRGAGIAPSLVDRPIPVAAGNELVLRVKACGICGSDLHAIKAADAEVYQRNVVMGHEFCGEVADIGPGVEGWAVGDRVLGVPVWYCETCESCRSGKPFECRNLKALGIEVDGAYAEYVRIKAATAVRIPDHVSDEIAVLYEPLSVALQAYRRGDCSADDSVLIVGGGPIGLSLAMLARHYGCRHVGLSEMQSERLKRAGACGADVVIDARQDRDPVAAFSARTGAPPTVILECVGLPGMFQQLIDAAPPRCRLVMAGTCLQQESFTVVKAAVKYLDVRFTYGYDAGDISEVFGLIASGGIDPSPMLSGTTSLGDLPSVMERMLSPNDECKVVLLPNLP